MQLTSNINQQNSPSIYYSVPVGWDETLADELGLDGPRSNLCLKLTSQTHRKEEASRKVSFELVVVFHCQKYKAKIHWEN